MSRKGKCGGITPGGCSSTLINLEEGDNSKFLSTALAVSAIGQTKADLSNVEEVKDRITQYFNLMIELDRKPTMSGLAMALGYSYRRVYEIVNNLPIGGMKGDAAKFYGHTENHTPQEVKDVITTAYNIMVNLWEDYMSNGKINPASGIFMGKNFYGMRDIVENVVSTPDNPLDNYSADDIADRYIQDK